MSNDYSYLSYTSISPTTGFGENNYGFLENKYVYVKSLFANVPSEFSKTYLPGDETFQKEFFSSLGSSKAEDIRSGFLYPAVLFNIPGFLVFERPPCFKRVEYLDKPMEHVEHESVVEYVYNLPLPWQIYIAEYDVNTMILNKVTMFFSNSCFQSSESYVYLPPLPNFYANASLCRPYLPNMEDVERYPKDLSGIMASAYDWIWNSGFNHDLVDGPLSVFQHNSFTFNDPNYQKVLPTSTVHRHLHPKNINHVLKKWEGYNLNTVLNVTWPNPAVTHNFSGDYEWFWQNDIDYVMDPSDLPDNEDEDDDRSRCYFEENFPNPYTLKKTYSLMISAILKSSEIYRQQSAKMYLGHTGRFNKYQKSLSS